ncbi:aldo/keto reductase [Paraglaciecola hydrolytica]|uniref:Aldo/keto reductase n=1 Tax=Paraglaciecola hydrolytica TaxID=1799789 RepID=A0A136A243_9ALTE|nr:aldo/keto reductase [Paraglaciecola hydrolytica]KXI29302.1 aldo/keto reductase [Paraglaciecola hydrolytica]
MKKRRLGKTGFEVSEIGLGCWQLGGDFGPLDEQQAGQILNHAYEHGINFWDTADVYGDGRSESLIAEWHKHHQQQDIKVATKVGRSGRLFPDKFTKQQVKSDIQASARRLGVECIDLIQLHCIPPQMLVDGEIFSWLQDFKHEGLIEHYGASVETIEEGLSCLKDSELATLQIIFNVFRQDAIQELLPKAASNDVGIIVRLPLASGLLSGKFSAQQQFAESDHRNYNRDGQAFSVGETFSGIPMNTGIELVDGLRQWVPAGFNMAEFALRWILDHPQVSSVIAGASKPQQVVANCLASAKPSLSEVTHQQLDGFYQQQVKQHIRGKI